MKKDARRPSWDEYFMEMAHVARQRSTCIRQQVGAVLVKDHRIIATGYSDTPAGIDNCGDGGCERCEKRNNGTYGANEHKDKCICVHAEQNALLQSAYHGVSTKGAVMYSTVTSCNNCAKMIINAGITEVVVDHAYTDEEGPKLLKKGGVKLRKISNKGAIL